jgi:esterase/lipase superfamily enzyme
VYTILPGPSLYLGTAIVRIGPQEKTWESLYALSTKPAKGSRPTLQLDSLDELAAIKTSEGTESLTPDAQRFFAAVNEALKRSLHKDLTIYVHGSNSTVELATAQAAQYRHFTGRNSVVLVFVWPSAGSGLRYFTDVGNAPILPT